MDSLGRHPRQGSALQYPPPHSEGPCPSPISHSHGLCRPLGASMPAPRVRGLRTSPTTSHPLDSLRRLLRTVVQGPRALNLAVEGETGWYSSLSCLEQEGHRDS